MSSFIFVSVMVQYARKSEMYCFVVYVGMSSLICIGIYFDAVVF